MADMHGQVADMQGQVALVTGGVRGIGLAICERLAARGVTVAAGYSREFLASPDSGYITGQVYAVNGGLYM
jgi:NAD(P)-dependent dehydrogenase (short-subunit alcohol dehydrogenase family)